MEQEIDRSGMIDRKLRNWSEKDVLSEVSSVLTPKEHQRENKIGQTFARGLKQMIVKR